jgi:hypothetical protein
VNQNQPCCQHAADLLELLEAEGASPRFFTAFEAASPEARQLLLKWLLLANPKRARGAP